jgi:glycosyltransferase involved in cell wall biosynthesis
MSELSIILPVLNDATEANLTVKSIRETTKGHSPEIVAIDDCSGNHLEIEDTGVRLIRNKHRAGAAACRHMGIHLATNDVCLLVDSHMRFEAGWFEKAMWRIQGRPKTLHCATMRGFDSKHPALGVPAGEYHGADLVLLSDKHILEGVWAKEKPDDSELSCLMGACYFVPREWYLRLGGLQFLRGWGCEEQLLSLKAYLSGGDIRLMRDVHIWHKFRLKEEKFPYEIEIYKTIYNKLFILHTMFQPEIALPLIEALSHTPEFERAREAIRQDWHLVISERARNRNLLVRDVAWLKKKFSI